MSTTVEVKDPSLIEIPSDMIQLGFTADGMPIAEPTDKAIAEGKEEDPKATLAELEQMRRERDEATQRLTAEAEAKTKAEAEAKAAREAVETVTGELATSKSQTLDAHYQKSYREFQAKEGIVRELASSMAAYEAQAEALSQQALAAEEAGDKAKAIDLNRKISRTEAYIAQLEAGKSQAVAEAEEAKYKFQDADKLIRTPAPKKEEPKPKVEPEAKKADAEPAKVSPDQWIDNVRSITSDDAAKWLKDHKDFVTDTAKNQQLTSFAQYYASKHGQAALKSDTFVAALNNEFFPEEETMTEETPAPKVQAEAKTKAKATPAAPVSRGGDVFSSTNLRAAKIFVPPDVAAFCKSANLNPESYVLSVREEILRGEKPKEWLDPSYDRGIR